MRIQKILSDRGVTSRRKAEEWIKQGRVSVNGSVCGLGDSADPDIDTLLVDGKPIPGRSGRLYIMLNKPRGYVTTLSDEKGRKDVSMLVADCGQRVYPVGRLDFDSEGLLVLTNDGEFANKLMHPSHCVDKVYSVLVTGYSEENVRKLSQPMVLDGYSIQKPEVKVVSVGERSKLEITIHEGRNRQVRRMCAIAGMQVLRLKRIREGGLELGDLSVGKWRMLNENEIENLK